MALTTTDAFAGLSDLFNSSAEYEPQATNWETFDWGVDDDQENVEYEIDEDDELF